MLAMCLSLEHKALRGNSLNNKLVRDLSHPESRVLKSKGKGGKGGKGSKTPKSSKSKSPGKGSSKSPGGKGKGGKGSKSSKMPKSSKSPGGKGKGGKGGEGGPSSNKVGKKGKKGVGDNIGETDDTPNPDNDDDTARDDDNTIIPNPDAECDTPEGRKHDILEIVGNISGDIAKNSYQDEALSWLMDDLETNACNGAEVVIERYVLATLYFSTNGGDWINNGWLNSFSVCQAWYGVICDNGSVVAINMRKFNPSNHCLRCDLRACSH